MFYSSKNVKTWSFFHIFFINIQPECHPHGVGGNTDELLLDGCVGGGCHWEEHQVGGGRVVVPFTFPIITHRDACYKYKWSFLSLFYPLNEKRRWVQPTKGRPPHLSSLFVLLIKYLKTYAFDGNSFPPSTCYRAQLFRPSSPSRTNSFWHNSWSVSIEHNQRGLLALLDGGNKKKKMVDTRVEM